MPVSDKMIDALSNTKIDVSMLNGLCTRVRNPEVLLQVGINAAWTKFDAEDESTWPKSECAPSGKSWLGIDKEGEPEAVEFDNYDNYQCWREVRECTPVLIVRYCDPADLLPSEEK